VVSGTFGTNAYQLVFFMLVFVGVLAGISAKERQRQVARWAPILVAASLGVIVLAQYRGLLVTTGLTVILIALVLGSTGARGWLVGASAIVALTVALVLVAQYLPFIKISQTFDQDPVDIASQRVRIIDQLDSLYSDTPRYAITGTGPGTYSSRGWQTFGKAESDSKSNVAGSYAVALTGGAYHTDVSDKYVQPLRIYSQANPVSGSYAVNSPFAEYISVAAEVGLPGLIVFVCLYVGAFLAALRRTARALRVERAGNPVPAILLAALVAFFVLLQMGLLENWLEVTRLTFIAWALLAIGTKEFEAQAPSTSA
jgi:O-antigen ligase